MVAGHMEGLDAIDVLTVNGERLSRSGEQTDPGTASLESVGQLGRGVDQVLTVVEHEQEVLVSQRVEQGFGIGPPRLLPQPEGGRDRSRDLGRLGERGEIDEPDTVGSAIQAVCGDVQSEAGLAGSARPGQGDDAGRSEQGPDFRELRLTSDETAERAGQVVRELGVVERPEGREVDLEAVGADLEDALWTTEVL